MQTTHSPSPACAVVPVPPSPHPRCLHLQPAVAAACLPTSPPTLFNPSPCRPVRRPRARHRLHRQPARPAVAARQPGRSARSARAGGHAQARLHDDTRRRYLCVRSLLPLGGRWWTEDWSADTCVRACVAGLLCRARVEGLPRAPIIVFPLVAHPPAWHPGGADWGLAQAVEEGTLVGPRILFSGHALSQTGGHGDMRGK